jgi:hypothetical protein
VPEVRTVEPERTFWDKVVIVHGLRRWVDKRVNSKAAVSACRGTIMTFIVAWRLRFPNLIEE